MIAVPASATDQQSGDDQYVAYVGDPTLTVEAAIQGASMRAHAAWVTPGCGTGEKADKVIKKWTRYVKTGSKTAYLRCGTQASYGYRHITNRHASQWDSIRTKYNLAAHWTDFMLNSTAGNLSSMGATLKSANNKDTYTSPLCIASIQTGKVVRVYDIVTPVAASSDNIISSYPKNGRSSDPMCGA